MSANERTYYLISCDVCQRECVNPYDDTVTLFNSAEGAAEAAREYDWAATLDGVRAVCVAADHADAYEEVRAEWEEQWGRLKLATDDVSARQGLAWKANQLAAAPLDYETFMAPWRAERERVRLEWLDQVRKEQKP